MSKLLPSEKEVLLWQDKSEKAVMAQLEKHYKDALEQIDEKIASMMGRNDANLPNVIRRIEYQRMLKEQIQTVLERLHSDTYETVADYLNASYTDAFVGTVYTLHEQGVPVILPIDQNVVVKAVTLDSKLKESLYTTMGKDMTALKRTVAAEVTRGIATGQMYSDIARNIRYAAGIPMRRAKTIARTEASRVQEQATFDAAQEAKAVGADVVKQWSSRRDAKTRDAHRMLDGQIREVEEAFTVDGHEAMHPHGFGKAALDINCRCTMLTRARAALDEDTLKQLEERAQKHGLLAKDKDKTQKAQAQNISEFKSKYLKAAEAVAQEEIVTNKNGEVIAFDERLNTEKRQQQMAVLKELSAEYNTKLTTVRPYEVGENTKRVAGSVSHWGEMKLSSAKTDVAIHEFAHSLAIVDDKKYDLDGNEAFWKDIRKIRKEYKEATRFKPGMKISAYADDDLDEFFAEAFTLAKAKQMGIELPDTYGSDLTYANKVLDAVNRHFGRPSNSGKVAETLENTGKSGIIRVSQMSNVSTGGRRNEEELSERQIAQAKAAAVKQGYDGEMMYSAHSNTSFHGSSEGERFHYLVIGTDAYPVSNNGGTANEMISLDGCMAHEVVGHYEAWAKGTAQASEVLEEAQASIRASKFGVDLTAEERRILYKDAVERLNHAGIDLADVEDDLDIWER